MTSLMQYHVGWADKIHGLSTTIVKKLNQIRSINVAWVQGQVPLKMAYLKTFHPWEMLPEINLDGMVKTIFQLLTTCILPHVSL